MNDEHTLVDNTKNKLTGDNHRAEDGNTEGRSAENEQLRSEVPKRNQV
jgi:hypothetical protein